MIKKNKLIQDTQIIFKKKFNQDPDIVSIAPGRVNIIGEHTDYNLGFAMPVAINRWICLLLAKQNRMSIDIINKNYETDISFVYSNLKNDKISWINLIKHTISFFHDKYNIKCGYKIAINSNLPIGCGLSSSTAFTISIVNSLCKLLSINVNKSDKIKLCQRIEQISMKTKGGLLDQIAILSSKKNELMKINFQNNDIIYFNYNLKGFSWVLVNSKINRELSNSSFNERVRECKEGFDFLNRKIQISNFSEINKIIINKYIYDPIIQRRLKHVVNENIRVENMYKSILNSDAEMIGRILFESHKSLSIDYEVSCKEIDYIIDISSFTKGWKGGRIIGGGFGGCSIHLIDKKYVDTYSKSLKMQYFEKFDIDLDIFTIQFSSSALAYEFNEKV